MPAQFAPRRLQRADVQSLLCSVVVRPLAEFSARFPEEMPSRVTVTLRDGRILTRTLADYPGFRTRPQSWDDAISKFTVLAEPHASQSVRADIVAAVHHLDQIGVGELTSSLGHLKVPARRTALQSA